MQPLAYVFLERNDWNEVNLFNNLFCIMIAFCGAGDRRCVCSAPAACLQRAVSLSLQLANITNTQIPDPSGPQGVHWRNLFDDYHISSALLRFSAVIISNTVIICCLWFRSVVTLCSKAPFNLQNTPTFPFDQSHSRLIKPCFTLNSSD